MKHSILSYRYHRKKKTLIGFCLHERHSIVVRRLFQTGPGTPPVCCQIGTSECDGKAAGD